MGLIKSSLMRLPPDLKNMGNRQCGYGFTVKKKAASEVEKMNNHKMWQIVQHWKTHGQTSTPGIEKQLLTAGSTTAAQVLPNKASLWKAIASRGIKNRFDCNALARKKQLQGNPTCGSAKNNCRRRCFAATSN